MTFRRYLLSTASTDAARAYDFAVRWLQRLHRLRTNRGGKLWP